MSQPLQSRTLATIGYLIAIVILQVTLIDGTFHIDENEIWLTGGLAGLILGSRLLNPHFTPPADAATNAFVATSSLATALAVDGLSRTDEWVIGTGLVICLLVFLTAVVAILVRRPREIEDRMSLWLLERVARSIGSPNVIFTIVIVISVWAFHRNDSAEVFAIMSLWTAIVALRPLDAAIALIESVVSRALKPKKDIVGPVVAYQSPGMVLVRQNDDNHYPTGSLLLIGDHQGPTTLGVTLNNVGRDEGRLLRVLSRPLPAQTDQHLKRLAVVDGAAVALPDSELDRIGLNELKLWGGRLRGIVDAGTSLDQLEWEVVSSQGLEEGRLVEVKIGETSAIYQLINGVTHDEVVQQKNKYGYCKAQARKIGSWNSESRSFEPAPWLPEINTPVFLREAAEAGNAKHAVGHFPQTSFPVGFDPHAAVTHNTAILGILGVGKSYLAAELLERIVCAGIKVVCLDLTDQYAELLSEFVDLTEQNTLDGELQAAGGPGTADRIKENGGSIKSFTAAVDKQITAFLDPANETKFRIINPAKFVATRQTSGAYNGEADMATLSSAEVTAIISDAVLKACQALGMTTDARACLVYEEAHSLVPEWNAVANEGDKSASVRSARAILQGRKFGLGCILVTQRTASVTKTILNQCNTIFAMRTFDDTGKSFLSNYIGSAYADVLQTLRKRVCVYFGKASSCENPVLIELNDRDKFIAEFREGGS